MPAARPRWLHDVARHPSGLLGCLPTATCAPSTGEDARGPDAGGSPDAGPVADAGTRVEAGADTEAGGEPDAGSSEDAGPHHDAGAQEDAGPFEIDADAVPGARCASEERIGFVEVSSWSGGFPYYATASLFDAPPPWRGPPS